MTIGELVRSLRKEKGWTQKRLAEVSGISPQFICEIEKGYLRKSGYVVKPSDKMVTLLAEAFGVPAVRFHTAMGRVEIDSEIEREAEEKFRALSEDNEGLELLATYRTLSDRDKGIIKFMVEKFGTKVSKN
jgi:transcriptional regulator with XRE-family HTH domain